MASGGSALIDTHVHCYDCFEIRPFVAAAAHNFDRAERELGLDERPTRVLLTMESGGASLLERLAQATDPLGRAGWEVTEGEESGTGVLRSGDAPPLLVVEGRQVVTAEGLEVLATPCSMELESGRPIEETLAAARDREAVPILPWGFGKWTGRRGRIVRHLLESHDRRDLLLGDNGGRLELGGKPKLLTLGAQRGFPVVRGSDPLPIASQVDRAGSSGSLLRGDFDATRPAASVRALLGRLAQTPLAFGRGAGPLSFVAQQLRMQLRRRGA